MRLSFELFFFAFFPQLPGPIFRALFLLALLCTETGAFCYLPRFGLLGTRCETNDKKFITVCASALRLVFRVFHLLPLLGSRTNNPGLQATTVLPPPRPPSIARVAKTKTKQPAQTGKTVYDEDECLLCCVLCVFVPLTRVLQRLFLFCSLGFGAIRCAFVACRINSTSFTPKQPVTFDVWVWFLAGKLDDPEASKVHPK